MEAFAAETIAKYDQSAEGSLDVGSAVPGVTLFALRGGMRRWAGLLCGGGGRMPTAHSLTIALDLPADPVEVELTNLIKATPYTVLNFG